MIELRDDAHQHVRIVDGHELTSNHFVRTTKHPTNVIVWGCFTSQGLGRIHIVGRTMNSEVYIKEIIDGRIAGIVPWRKWLVTARQCPLSHQQTKQSPFQLQRYSSFAVATKLAGCKPDRELVVDIQATTEDQRTQEQALSYKCIPECVGKRSGYPSNMPNLKLYWLCLRVAAIIANN